MANRVLLGMKKEDKTLPLEAEKLKRRGAGMAAATRGRARTFVNRKREASKKACRGKVTE